MVVVVVVVAVAVAAAAVVDAIIIMNEQMNKCVFYIIFPYCWLCVTSGCCADYCI